MATNLLGMAFLPYYRHILDILETNRDIKKTAKGIFHQMCYTAGGTALGGLLAGPPGALVGGLIGAYAGYRTVESYESLIDILKALTDQEKEELVQKVQNLVGSSGLEALTTFIGQQVNREVFVNLVKSFAEKSKAGA